MIDYSNVYEYNTTKYFYWDISKIFKDKYYYSKFYKYDSIIILLY